MTFSSVQSLFSEEANATSIHGCSPQENHPTSGGNFFQPIFVVQPTKNILGSDPASGRQLMPLSFRSPYWSPTKIGNAWSQAGVWSSLIVVATHSRKIVRRCFSLKGIT